MKTNNKKKSFLFFDMSAQEGGGGFELVTSTLLGVIPADCATS
jgi:hypothetical protein